MKLSKEVSNRITMLRPLLIIGVVFVHVEGLSGLPSEGAATIFDWFASFFKNSVFRGTVPTMSLIAGFLLFNAGLDRAPSKLFKKKFMTLGIPFVIFNLWCFAFMIARDWTLGTGPDTLENLSLPPFELFAKLFGIHDLPFNGPLHFVRDMIVTVMLVPILSYLIRYAPWLGLIALAIFFGTDLDGTLIFRASSLILFYIGGVAAVYKWNVLSLDQYAKPCLLAFLAICLFIIGFGIDDNTVLVMAAPFLIWPAASMLTNTKLEAWAMSFSKYSFFIFVTHAPILGMLWRATLAHATWIPYAIYWFAAPLLTIGFLKVAYDLASRFAPTAFNFAIGRSKTQVFLDRRKTSRPGNAPVYTPEFRLTLGRS